MSAFRHELKFIMSPANAVILKKNLRALMALDPNANDHGYYMVRSLYFDTLSGRAFFDKLDGVEFRRKYRIRYYNNNTDFIRLESKLKIHDLSQKTQERLDLALAHRLMDRDTSLIDLRSDTVLAKFALDMKLNDLRPAVIVDYQRTAFIHPSLDVRITFDEHIRSRIYDTALFNTEYGSVPVMAPNEVVLEVKYDEIIPQTIAEIIKQVPMIRQAVSKYAYCYNKK
jgi:SPX domain protein involved in polyphosphate accumulation